MRNQALSLRRGALLLVAGAAVAVGVWVYAAESPILAEDESATPDASESKPQETTRRKRHRAVHKASPKPADAAKSTASKDGAPKDGAAAPASAASPAARSAEAKTTGTVDFAAGLDKAGASACRSQVNALATSTMGSVEKFNTISNWSQVESDKRAVSLAIGQKFATGSAVPFGVSQVISAPNPRGSCDGFTIQVFPSPLSCAKLRDSIRAQHGQQIGDLAGIPLMQDAAGRTMLVPTAADTCVLVATRTFYAK